MISMGKPSHGREIREERYSTIGHFRNQHRDRTHLAYDHIKIATMGTDSDKGYYANCNANQVCTEAKSLKSLFARAQASLKKSSIKAQFTTLPRPTLMAHPSSCP